MMQNGRISNQGHGFEFSTNLYALEHVHVVKI